MRSQSLAGKISHMRATRSTFMPATVIAISAVAIALFVISGCGDETISSTQRELTFSRIESKGPRNLVLRADQTGRMRFRPQELSAKAGSLTITFENATQTPHNVVMRDSTGKKLAASQTITRTVDEINVGSLSPGTYTYESTVPGQDQMKGLLVVQP